MGTLRCPKCGSYNTGTAYLNYVGRGLEKVAEIGAIAAMYVFSGVGHATHGAHQFVDEIKNDKPVKGNKCHACGYEW